MPVRRAEKRTVARNALFPPPSSELKPSAQREARGGSRLRGFHSAVAPDFPTDPVIRSKSACAFEIVAAGPVHLKKTIPFEASTIAPSSLALGCFPCDCIIGRA